MLKARVLLLGWGYMSCFIPLPTLSNPFDHLPITDLESLATEGANYFRATHGIDVPERMEDSGTSPYPSAPPLYEEKVSYPHLHPTSPPSKASVSSLANTWLREHQYFLERSWMYSGLIKTQGQWFYDQRYVSTWQAAYKRQLQDAELSLEKMRRELATITKLQEEWESTLNHALHELKGMSPVQSPEHSHRRTPSHDLSMGTQQLAITLNTRAATVLEVFAEQIPQLQGTLHTQEQLVATYRTGLQAMEECARITMPLPEKELRYRPWGIHHPSIASQLERIREISTAITGHIHLKCQGVGLDYGLLVDTFYIERRSRSGSDESLKGAHAAASPQTGRRKSFASSLLKFASRKSSKGSGEDGDSEPTA